MAKIKEVRIVVKRINNNQFIVKNQEFDFLQLANWFIQIVTDKE